MMTWFEYLRLVVEWMWLEVSGLPVDDFFIRVRRRAAQFLRRTRRVMIAVLAIPLFLLVIGVIFHSRSIIAIAGIIATIGWGIILFAFAALLEFATVIYREIKGTGAETRGRIYLQAVATIMLGEMLVVGYAVIVPLWNNPGAIPIVAMFAILLATMITVWEMKYNVFRQIAFWIAVVAFIFFTMSFFLPNTFSVLEKRSPEVDIQLSFWARNLSFDFLSDVPPLLGLGIFVVVVVVVLTVMAKTASAGAAAANNAPKTPTLGNKWFKRVVIVGLAALAIYFAWPYAKVLAGKIFGENIPAVVAQRNPGGGLIIPANSPLVDTGRIYKTGEVIEWSATGQVSATSKEFDGEYMIVSPNGWTIHPLFDPPRLYLADNCPPMALVGRIGNNPWFCMGTQGRRQAEDDGALYVAFNDMVGFKGGRKNVPHIFFADNFGRGELRLN